MSLGVFKLVILSNLINLENFYLNQLFFASSKTSYSFCTTNLVVLVLTEYTDISVDCGTEYINLAIEFCPVIYTGYNESELILNNIMNNPDCHATLDTTVLPPVARFRFPINSTNSCGSNFVVSNSYKSK